MTEFFLSEINEIFWYQPKEKDDSSVSIKIEESSDE